MQLAPRNLGCSPLHTYTLPGELKPNKALVSPHGMGGAILSFSIHNAIIDDDGLPGMGKWSKKRPRIKRECAFVLHAANLWVGRVTPAGILASAGNSSNSKSNSTVETGSSTAGAYGGVGTVGASSNSTMGVVDWGAILSPLLPPAAEGAVVGEEDNSKGGEDHGKGGSGGSSSSYEGRCLLPQGGDQ